MIAVAAAAGGRASAIPLVVKESFVAHDESVQFSTPLNQGTVTAKARARARDKDGASKGRTID